MKNIIIIVLIGIFLISGCIQQPQPQETPSETTQPETVQLKEVSGETEFSKVIDDPSTYDDQQPQETPSGTTQPEIMQLEETSGESEFSKVTEDLSTYDDEKMVLTGQTFLFESPPRLLVNGKSGVNLEGNTQDIKSGFYTVEGIYDSPTNTLTVEKVGEFSIDCNTPIETGKNVVKELVCVKTEGLIATPPKEIVDELNSYISIPNTPTENLEIYPYIVYNTEGIYLVISDQFSILPTELIVEYEGETYHLYFSAGEVQGTLVKTSLDDIGAKFREKLGERGFDPKEFKGIVIADSIKPLAPIQASVGEINNNPSKYAFKRVEIDASYIVTTARIDYGEETKIRAPMGLGVLADKFTDFYEEDRTLRLETIDPERKVWQFRQAKVIGTILYPTEDILKYFDYSAPSTKQKIKEEIKPVLIVDTLVDDPAQLSDLSELNQITGIPSKYWNKVVEFEGYALGANVPVVKYAGAAIGQDIPVEFNLMAVGISDPEGIKTLSDLQTTIPGIAIIGLNNELIEATEAITGKYKFKVAVSEMPKELINYEKLKGFDTAFFLLEKEFIAGLEELIAEVVPTTLPPLTTPPPETTDSDGDGIFDNVDECPYVPENFNEYQDEDGCPDIKPGFP